MKKMQKLQPMKLAIFNGSPRGKNSNTSVLLQNFRKGFEENGGEIVSHDLLIQENRLEEQLENFKNADCIFIAFPLYVDSLPGMVKKFIEEVGEFDGTNKNIFFLVHSGFPEAVHSRAVKKYLAYLATQWNMNFLGIIVKPGSEGIRIRPGKANQKLFGQFQQLGHFLAREKKLDTSILKQLEKPFKFPKFILLIFRLLKSTGIFDKYWNMKLKENDAYKNRFAAPYID
jgi:multimeric flavodoxin WrbA